MLPEYALQPSRTKGVRRPTFNHFRLTRTRCALAIFSETWPAGSISGTLPGMEHRCEVCESFRPGGALDPARELLEVSFGERRVLLCRGHAGIARNSQVASFDELRALYAESEGQRSYVSRRTRDARSGDGATRNAGRRASDLAR